MSNTNRGKARNPEDFYPTEHWVTDAALKALPQLAQYSDGIWCEPAAGEGHIVQAVESFGYHPTWHLLDLRPECKKPLQKLNVDRSRLLITTGEMFQFWAYPKAVDVLITNPPYTFAEDFIRRSLLFAKVVIMLLRLNYIGSEEREDLFDMFPPDLYPVHPRPFPDATEYAWFTWGLSEGHHWQRIKGFRPEKERKPKKLSEGQLLFDLH